MNELFERLKLHKYSPNSINQKEINQQLERRTEEIKKKILYNYYHQNITREHAEKLLIDYNNKYNSSDGCFLIRPCTSSSDDFSLSVIFNGKPHHYKITHTLDAYYAIGDGPIIHGLDQLIEKYQTNKHGLPYLLAKTYIPGEPLPVKTRVCGSTNLLHETVAKVKELNKVKLILNSPYCPDINERDEMGRTALDIACEYDNVDAIKEIMKKKPLTNLKAKDDYTPLHRAAEHNSMHCIEYLLSNNYANPTERLVDDNSVPLHVAVEFDNFMCVKMLLKYNIPDKPRTIDDKTPLDIAIEKGNDDTIKILSEYQPKKVKSKINEWLHEENVTRDIAQKILINAKKEYGDGVFLVRKKGNNFYVLSLMSGNDFYNYEICIKDGEKFYYIDDGPYFRSLEQLIEHHIKYEDGLPVKLKQPIPPNSIHCQNMSSSSISSVQSKTSTEKRLERHESVPRDHINTMHINKEIQCRRQTKKKQQNSLKIISQNDITLDSIIGEGEFGTVYKGKLEGTKQVAIKMLKDCKATGDFKREAEIMGKLGNHPCILRIFGIIPGKDQFMMVQELMVCSMLDKLYEVPRMITDYNLKNWAVEILSGMEHMEQNKIVHRDLAARNILLGSNLQAKISDFGLSRAYEGDEYTQRTDSKIPIKWYAPESIERCRFTSKSDVWSFGVTLWEMWSYGDVPYGVDKNGSEVYHFIQIGGRLEKPIDCPSHTYEIMKKCWEWNEDIRISFREIKQFIGKDSDYEKLNSIYFDTGQF